MNLSNLDKTRAVAASVAVCRLVRAFAESRLLTLQVFLGQGRIMHTAFMIVEKGMRPFSLGELMTLSRVCNMTPDEMLRRSLELVEESGITPQELAIARSCVRDSR